MENPTFGGNVMNSKLIILLYTGQGCWFCYDNPPDFTFADHFMAFGLMHKTTPRGYFAKNSKISSRLFVSFML